MSRGLVLLLLLFVGGVVALYWPLFAGDRFDSLALSRAVVAWLITVTMLMLGSLLPTDEVLELASRWPLAFAGVLAQCTIMPLAAWVGAKGLAFDESIQLGMILVGCVPGAMASNVLTLAARGNVSYSISLTLCATILSPLTIPLLLKLLIGGNLGDVWSTLDPVAIGQNLFLTVALPVVIGFLLSLKLSAWRRCTAICGSVVAEFSILWIIAAVVAINRERLIETSPLIVVGLLAINVLGYAGGYGVGWVLLRDEAMRRALTLEVGMQNAGLGSVLALTLFPEHPAAAISTAGYTFGCMLTGSALAAWWCRHGFKPRVV